MQLLMVCVHVTKQTDFLDGLIRINSTETNNNCQWLLK